MSICSDPAKMKRCQDDFIEPLGGRSVVLNPIPEAVRSFQRSAPKGAPRATYRHTTMSNKSS